MHPPGGFQDPSDTLWPRPLHEPTKRKAKGVEQKQVKKEEVKKKADPFGIDRSRHSTPFQRILEMSAAARAAAAVALATEERLEAEAEAEGVTFVEE